MKSYFPSCFLILYWLCEQEHSDILKALQRPDQISSLLPAHNHKHNSVPSPVDSANDTLRDSSSINPCTYNNSTEIHLSLSRALECKVKRKLELNINHSMAINDIQAFITLCFQFLRDRLDFSAAAVWNIKIQHQMIKDANYWLLLKTMTNVYK